MTSNYFLYWALFFILSFLSSKKYRYIDRGGTSWRWDKSRPISSKKNPKKVANAGFYFNSEILKISQKGAKYLGYFCKRISDHDLSKRAQSGHTVCNSPYEAQTSIGDIKSTSFVIKREVLLKMEKANFQQKLVLVSSPMPMLLGPVIIPEW